MKKLIQLLLIYLFSILEIHAQSLPCPKDTILFINTGYDEGTNTVLPVGSGISTADISWIIVYDTDIGSNEPRPAYAINKAASSWKAPMSNTQWITSYPEAENAITGSYNFIYTFCLEPGFTAPYLSLAMRSDNKTEVFLNGHLIGSTSITSFGDTNPTLITSSDISYFNSGANELKIINYNSEKVKGLNIKGFVRTNNFNILQSNCCDLTSIISGIKWNDSNGDGIKQIGEPVLSGWGIQLSNGQTTYTDNHGYYFFTGLMAGIYSITEIQKPGWFNTYPISGSHQIILGSQEVKDHNDFGNDSIICDGSLSAFVDSFCAGKPTYFVANYSTSSTLSIVTWNFGDGQFGTGQSLTHTYITPGSYTIIASVTTGPCTYNDTLQVVILDCILCEECISSFAPIPGKNYVLSAWVKEANSVGKTTFTGPAIIIACDPVITLFPITASGLIIDGWQRIEHEFTVPIGTNAIRIKLSNIGSNEVFFDDIRIDPFEAGTKSFVYDPKTLRLMAELDERNYATFYEYDKEGALIRVKKETERGIKTIKESGNNTQIKY